jgi:ferredoxin
LRRLVLKKPQSLNTLNILVGKKGGWKMVTISVDFDACEGCGTCAELCPDIFEIRDEKSWVLKEEGSEDCDLEEVVQSCPTEAIKVEGMDIKFERKAPF